MYDRQCVHNIDACLCLNIVVAKHSNFFVNYIMLVNDNIANFNAFKHPPPTPPKRKKIKNKIEKTEKKFSVQCCYR